MRTAFGLLALLLMLPQVSVAQSTPPSEQPMFGGATRTPAMIATDRQMIAAAEKSGLTRAQSVRKAMDLGWQYFAAKNYGEAMKRFNEAWLFDPDNGDAFHGFAAVTLARDNNPLKASFLFSTAIAKPRQSPGVYLDYGRFLMNSERQYDAVLLLRRARAFPAIEADAQALLTLALVKADNMADACYESEGVTDKAAPPLRDEARAIAKQSACTLR